MGAFSERELGLTQAVDSIFSRKCETDSKLNAILKKIEAGTADMRDTAEFSKQLAHLARQSIYKVYKDDLGTRPQWSDVQATVDRILHENYETINELEARVQKDLDRKSGVNLAPIKPDYPTERVKKVIDAAANAKDNEQAVRRMGSPVENITVSFHDDYIRENADFRTKAGIECYVERITDGTCCQWCTDIAGKYLMREQPEGFWGKHDNCSCMIIYDGKVLRGQIGENGRRGRRWVEEPPKVEYTPPKRFSHDEAEKLQAEKLPRRLTREHESGIINSEELKPMRYSSEFNVSEDILQSKEFRSKFDSISDDPITAQQYYEMCCEILRHRSGNNGEDLYYHDLLNDVWYKSTSSKYAGRAIKNKEIAYAQENCSRGSIIAFHNHANSKPPSIDDLEAAFDYGYAKGYVLCHNGKIFEYSSASEVIDRNVIINDALFYYTLGMSEESSYILAYKDNQERFGYTFREVL